MYIYIYISIYVYYHCGYIYIYTYDYHCLSCLFRVLIYSDDYHSHSDGDHDDAKKCRVACQRLATAWA